MLWIGDDVIADELQASSSRDRDELPIAKAGASGGGTNELAGRGDPGWTKHASRREDGPSSKGGPPCRTTLVRCSTA